jgi:hypothetical protein
MYEKELAIFQQRIAQLRSGAQPEAATGSKAASIDWFFE